MSKRSAGQPRNIANNRRAWHDYEILDRLECGISLVGSEVKSLRAGRASIGEAYVVFDNGEAFLIHAHIPIYPQAGPQNHQTDRKRRLLMSHKQISKWTDKAKASGYTVVPLQLYFKGSWIKIEIGYGRGRKQYDKRQKLKEQDHKREVARALRNNSRGR